MSAPTRPQPNHGPGTWGDVDAHRLHARVMGRLFGEPAAPTTIGRFRVERRLGEGAMGVVYAAVDAQLGRRVALKLLHPHLQGDAQGRARLLREARAMARLEHEHVARIYEVGAWNDQVYLAMELIEGVTLDAWLRERPRPWQAVLAVYLQAGRALAAAHHAGLLHRDFKPENVIVDGRGRARVLDFGLTCALDAGEDAARPGLDDEDLAPLTRTGSILGTPAYMAPEQQRWGAAEPRSDQFSFCVALFEGLFGLRPFGAILRPGPVEIAPIPRESRVPARIRRAIARGLAEKPEARWPTMDDLLAALQRPARALPTTFAAGAAVGAVVVGLVALGVIRAQQDELAAAVRRGDASEQMIDALRDAADAAGARGGGREGGEALARALRVREAAAALLPDDPTAAALLLRELDDPGVLARRALAAPISAAVFDGHDGPVRSVRWLDAPQSGSGAAIETVDAAGRRRRFPLAGGPAQDLAGDDLHEPGRSPDGRVLVRERGRDLSFETDGVARPLRGAAGPLAALAWTRDGQRVAGGGAGGEVWFAPRAGARARVLGRGAAVTALAWDGAGEHLAVGRDDGAIDVWRVAGRPRRVAALAAEGGVISLALGTGWLASGGDDGSARVWHLGARPRPFVLRGHRGPVRALDLQPGGAAVVTGGDDGSARVWRLTPAALAVHDLGGPVNTVAFSPDGELLAAAGDRGVGVWLLPAGGGAGERRVHAGTVFALAWSPDGRELAVADERGAVTWLPRGEGAPRRDPGVRRGSLLALAWDPRRGALVAGGLDESLTTWPTGQPGSAAAPIPLAQGTIEALAVSPVDARLVAVTADGVVVLVDGAEKLTRGLGHALGDVAWSPRGDLLALAGESRALARVAVADATLGEFGRAPVPLWSVAWDPHDRFVVAGGVDGALYVWPRESGARLEVYPAHGDVVLDLAFDPAGDRLASAGADGRVVVWPRLDADLRPRLAAATTACLDRAARERHLGESAEIAAARVDACRAGN